MRRALAAAVFAILAAACASGPARAPEWTLNAPKPDATNRYFVGSSSDPSGDVAKARSDAAANLISDIMRYIGAKVSVNSTATARATLESYSADILSTVTSSSTNRLAGFSIKESYVYRDKKTGRVTVYVLASYVSADLEKEKTRIAALFQEIDDAVAKPESEGKALAAVGRSYDAVRKFVEAAAAAAGPEIENPDQKLQRNVNAARTLLAKLRFDTMGVEGYAALVGRPFPRPFLLRLVSGEAAGVPGASLLVSYQRRQGSRLVPRSEPAATDQSGLLSYLPPPPDFVGKAKLLVRVDFQSSLELLNGLPPRYEAYRAALVDELAGISIEIPYEVSSNARMVPTGIAIVDLDESGAVAGSAAQAGLVEALARERFDARIVAVDPASLAALSEAAAATAGVRAGAERMAFGYAKIESVRKDGGSYLASARAAVKVIELSSGRLLYSAERSVTAVGDDEPAARRAAYRELGANAIGKDLLASLP
jgi:hypothetical protein